jgi:hypothetical protein
MVDWDLVDKRRAKGWDWDRIAADPKVGFQAEEAAGEPGRALRALYYQRRSKAKRRSGDVKGPGEEGEASGARPPTSRLARIGAILAPMFAIWLVLALFFPSTIGTIGGTTLYLVPTIGILLGVGGFLLGFGLLTSVERWTSQVRVALTIGVVLGLVLSGGMALVSVIAGCPNLTATTTGEPLNWSKAPNAAWTVDGAPTFFFYGAVACPYCSASSWAIWYALSMFGTWNGLGWSHSASDDVYPNTPAVDLSAAALVSRWVAPVLVEGPDPNAIHVPSIGCPASAYVSTYDSSGSIPFAVVNGQYVHTQSIVGPLYLRQSPGDGNSPPLTVAQVQGQITNASGVAWDQISAPATMIEALIVVANHDNPQLPQKVLGDPAVQSDIGQIH